METKNKIRANLHFNIAAYIQTFLQIYIQLSCVGTVFILLLLQAGEHVLMCENLALFMHLHRPLALAKEIPTTGMMKVQLRWKKKVPS